MTAPGDEVEFSEDTELRCASTTIREAELERLMEEDVFSNVDKDEDAGFVEGVDIDFGRLARLMYRYDTLDMAASHVKVDILNHFRDEDANKFSTGELVEATGRNDSNVSEALGELVEEEKLEKIQKGLYAWRD